MDAKFLHILFLDNVICRIFFLSLEELSIFEVFVLIWFFNLFLILFLSI